MADFLNRCATIFFGMMFLLILLALIDTPTNPVRHWLDVVSEMVRTYVQ